MCVYRSPKETLSILLNAKCLVIFVKASKLWVSQHNYMMYYNLCCQLNFCVNTPIMDPCNAMHGMECTSLLRPPPLPTQTSSPPYSDLLPSLLRPPPLPTQTSSPPYSDLLPSLLRPPPLPTQTSSPPYSDLLPSLLRPPPLPTQTSSPPYSDLLPSLLKPSLLGPLPP